MSTVLHDLWDKTCTILRDKLSPDVFERWIAVIHPRSCTEEHLILDVANDFYSTWLEENYLPLIQMAVGVVTGRQMIINIKVDRQAVHRGVQEHRAEEERNAPAASKLSEPSNRKEQRAQTRRLESRLNPNNVFESFVVGDSNNFAHAASMAVAQSPAKAYNPLFIYGATGLGKTHLMQAVGNYSLLRNATRTCYISSEAFTNEYIEAIKRNNIEEFRRRYRSMDMLLIDDMQFLAGKERIQEEFFHTFNALFDGHKQIVMTCDRPASEIPGLEQRLVSRFEWGLVVELEMPDLETRMAILGKKAQSMGLNLPPEVMEFLARRIRSNVRRMEGALIRVSSYRSLMPDKPMGTVDLERLLKEFLDEEEKPQVNMERIQRMVADRFDIRYTDLLGKKRPASIALPRQVAMYLCRELTAHSFPEIGEAFGKNHATVMHAYRTVSQRIKRDPELRGIIEALRSEI